VLPSTQTRDFWKLNAYEYSAWQDTERYSTVVREQQSRFMFLTILSPCLLTVWLSLAVSLATVQYSTSPLMPPIPRGKHLGGQRNKTRLRRIPRREGCFCFCFIFNQSIFIQQRQVDLLCYGLPAAVPPARLSRAQNSKSDPTTLLSSSFVPSHS
jgi:hypothetical protein